MINKLLIGLLMLAEVYVVGFASLVTYTLNVRMTNGQPIWYNLGMSMMLALAVSGALYYINRLLVMRRYILWPRFHLYTTVTCFCVITLTAIASKLFFS